MELPKAPFYRRWSVILAGVIGLAAIAAILGWRGLQGLATTTTTAPPTITTVTVPPPSTLPEVVTTATTPSSSIGSTSKPDDVLWQAEGADRGRSPGFRARGGWRVQWAFDCTNFEKFGNGNFKITGDGDFEQVQIESVAIEASGTHRFQRGGFGHLRIESVCERWTITVLAGP